MNAVVRVIGISTRYEEQQKHNITLFCVLHYDNDDDNDDNATVTHMLQPPSPIGNDTAAHIEINEHRFQWLNFRLKSCY